MVVRSDILPGGQFRHSFRGGHHRQWRRGDILHRQLGRFGRHRSLRHEQRLGPQRCLLHLCHDRAGCRQLRGIHVVVGILVAGGEYPRGHKPRVGHDERDRQPAAEPRPVEQPRNLLLRRQRFRDDHRGDGRYLEHLCRRGEVHPCLLRDRADSGLLRRQDLGDAPAHSAVQRHELRNCDVMALELRRRFDEHRAEPGPHLHGHGLLHRLVDGDQFRGFEHEIRGAVHQSCQLRRAHLPL